MAENNDDGRKHLVFSDNEALQFHSRGRRGKIEIVATKPVESQRDLSMAYSPGVAVPVKAIAENPDSVYDYTARGNMVAVITNGTAILGLGNLGALAAKPVMEGKVILFKRFADVDAIDLELDTEDIDKFVAAVELLGPTFGGINLEDIRAPECFIIEDTLRSRMNIPVFHDDQHGTAIITAAGIINALYLTKREAKDVRVVVNGAGAAAIACTELVRALGVPAGQITMCDSKGVIYEGRADGMNQWKAAYAVHTEARTLADALKGADIFLGLSVAGAVTRDMVRSMAENPIIFAMANPNPEISPEDVREVSPHAIVATGRSDYPNQVNNVLGFPYIFRGALDVRATRINDEMKLAAARALADLARETVPDEVAAAYGGDHHFGPDYIIPAPFDPRLIEKVPVAVARAAMETGVAQKPIEDFESYTLELKGRLNPTSYALAAGFQGARQKNRRIVFAEGEQEVVVRAAISMFRNGYGQPLLIGREGPILENFERLGVTDIENYPIHNSAKSPLVPQMADYLYERLQRRGFLRRDIQRWVNNERNVFGALMLKLGEADVMVSGTTRHFHTVMDQIALVLDPIEGTIPFAFHLYSSGSRTILIADTTVNQVPTARDLAGIASKTATVARKLGLEPRVAFVSNSNFGNPNYSAAESLRGAVEILDSQSADFEYDGEMSIDIALNRQMAEVYPFTRLTGEANILVMPSAQAANIAAKLLKELGGGRIIGPVLMNMECPVQIASMTSRTDDLITLAALAASGIVQ